MELTPLQQTVNLLTKSQRILFLTHARADGDGLSSILALSAVLRKLGKITSPVVTDPAPFILRFLPELNSLEKSIAGANDLIISLPLVGREPGEVFTRVVDGNFEIAVRSRGAPFTASEINFRAGVAEADLIVVCDTPELPLLGSLFEMNPNLFYEIPVVNIDHHPSNVGFGRVNLVDVTAASATELVLRVIQNLETETKQKLIDADIATLLLTGVITDTGSFQNANTTPRAFEIAADLIELGARQQEIIHHVYKTKQLSTLRLWGRVLSKIQYDAPARLVWSVITKEDLLEMEADDAEATGIIDELMTNAPGAEVVLLLKQNGVGVSGSLRTTTPAVSANEIAGMFGGGGHFQAAGFKILDKTVEEVTGEVIGKIRAYQMEHLNFIEGQGTTLPAGRQGVEGRGNGELKIEHDEGADVFPRQNVISKSQIPNLKSETPKISVAAKRVKK